MANKNRNGMGHMIVTFFVMGIVVFSSGCSRHLSPTANTTKQESNENKKATSAGNSLVGIWQLDKVEAPDLMGKLATYGSQPDVDRITKTLEQFKTSLKGLTVTFNEDGSYQSTYNGQSDVGKWSINETKEIRAVSKVTSNVELYQIVSQTDTSIQAQINEENVNLLLTFIRK